MRKADTSNYFDDEERAWERVVAIYVDVTPADWARLPFLSQAFFERFETGLLFRVMGTPLGPLEVWFLADHEGAGIGLDEGEAFIQEYESAVEAFAVQANG